MWWWLPCPASALSSSHLPHILQRAQTPGPLRRQYRHPHDEGERIRDARTGSGFEGGLVGDKPNHTVSEFEDITVMPSKTGVSINDHDSLGMAQNCRAVWTLVAGP